MKRIATNFHYHTGVAASLVAATFGLLATAGTADAFIDLTGDVFGSGSVRPDITSVDGTTLGTSVRFTVTYAGAIAPGSAFAANSITGFIDLDTDQNAATGGTVPFGGQVTGGNSWLNFFIPSLVPGPTIALGDEYYVDLGSEIFHAGFIDIVRTSDGAMTGMVPIAFGATSFTFDILLGQLGGDDGIINFGALTGTFLEPTDRAPNGDSPGTIGAAVPEPTTLALLGLGVAGLGFSRRRKLNSRSNTLPTDRAAMAWFAPLERHRVS